MQTQSSFTSPLSQNETNETDAAFGDRQRRAGLKRKQVRPQSSNLVETALVCGDESSHLSLRDETKKVASGADLGRFQRLYHSRLDGLKSAMKHVPCTSLIVQIIGRLPRSVKLCLFISWALWKVVVTMLLLKIMYQRQGNYDHNGVGRLQLAKSPGIGEIARKDNLRILHIVTVRYQSVSVDGEAVLLDHLQHVTLPVLKHSLTSLITRHDWQVDVFFIFPTRLSAKHLMLVSEALQSITSTLEIWDDALPLTYGESPEAQTLHENIKDLPKLQRLVIDERLDKYDFFVSVTDDEIINADHVEAFMELMRLLESLQNGDLKGAERLLDASEIDCLVPGFLPVEVRPSQSVERDSEKHSEGRLDTRLCCSYRGVNVTSDEVSSGKNQAFVDKQYLEVFSEAEISVPIISRIGSSLKLALTSRHYPIHAFWNGFVAISENTPRDGHVFMASRGLLQRLNKLCGNELFDLLQGFEDGSHRSCKIMRFLVADSYFLSRQLVWRAATPQTRHPFSLDNLIEADRLLRKLSGSL